MVAPFNSANAFDLSHDVLASCHMGQLVPVECEEVLPGDVWRHTPEAVVRLMPMVSPIMQDVDITLHSFFVPYRILMDDWTPFITGGESGTDNTTWPYITAPAVTGFAVGSLADYLGCPTGVPGIQVSALPFRAYAKIYNDWYRDQFLVSEIAMSKGNGSDVTTNTSIQRRCWKRDLYTSARPFVQLGPEVYLPLGLQAPVYADKSAVSSKTGQELYWSKSTDNSKYVSLGDNYFSALTVGDTGANGSTQGVSNLNGNYDSNIGALVPRNLVADLKNATSPSLSEVRTAFQIKRYMEALAFSGARLTEYLLSMFGVKSSDARLQRSEFLGAIKGKIEISEVLQTSSTDATSPQGNMSGRGVSKIAGGYVKYFEEHGVVITLASIMPKALYQQGLRRMWTRKTRWDYPLPVFSHLGMQEVKNQEVFCQSPSVVDSDGNVVNEQDFGYVPRYEEIRRIPSRVCGEFKTTLNTWHMSRIFDNLPQLNQQFIECNPSKRIFAVTDPNEDECLIKVTHHLQAVRRFPKFGTPGLIDHM